MCNFSGMIKNVLSSLRQRAGPQRICSRQKSIRSGTARDSFSQTPHMRGKGVVQLQLLCHVRITPAHAGKRNPRCSVLSIGGDHPRTCGEKLPSKFPQFVISGSPPHMRGKAKAYLKARFALRITPAHAGKSIQKGAGLTLVTGSPPHMRGKGPFCHLRRSQKLDHPRTCGEKGNLSGVVQQHLGSPPHMRGKEGP